MIKGKPYSSYRYEQILKEELFIACLSKGAVSITEVDNLPINDRVIILSSLRQAEDERRKHLQQLKEQREMHKTKHSGR